MPDLKHFRLPDVGEGLTEADIVSWKVKPGDTVAVNDVLVEIETAKSLVELPSPFAGTVAQLMAAEGETVAVGSPIIAVDVADGTTAAGPDADRPGEGSVNGRTPVLVGYGPRDGATRRRPRRGAAAAAPPSPPPAASAAVHSAFTPTPSPSPAQTPVEPVAVLAKPPVRRLARDLGVDLSVVAPSGPGRVVTRGDVEAAARAHAVPEDVGVQRAGGGETRVPVRGVRKATAAAMVASAFTAPHVTEWVDVDVTRTLRLVRRLREDPELAGVHVGPLLLVARAFLLGLRRHPEANASWDEAAQEIVLKRDVNLGIAAATPRGLVVPNVKAADAMTLPQLGAALDALVQAAREGRTSLADMQGGTATITNVGVFGVDGGTPILNPGEAAILAVGAVRERAWVHRGRVRPRSVCQLSLSFDHRLVDGELGSRLLSDVARLLQDPGLGLAWG